MTADPPGFPAAQRSVSIKDVAKRAGVSVTTVSNVLNSRDRVSSDTRERVLAAIDQLGYVRNAAAWQLRAGRSRTIGLIVPDGANPFYSAIARGAEDAAVEYGGAVLVGNSNHSPEREAHYIALFEEQRVQGVLIAPVGDPDQRVEALRRRGLPAVVIGRTAQPESSSVSIDNVAGGYLATRHLLEVGRRRLAFIGGPASTPGIGDRLAGALRAVAEQPDATLEVLETTDLGVAAGRAAALALLDRTDRPLPDGIFFANDLLATGALQAFLLIRHVDVPGDVAMIGYDDIDFAQAAVVPLSSIRQPAALIGRTAVELLAREAEAPDENRRHILFQPELVARESSLGEAPSRTRPASDTTPTTQH
ncbi:LacI family DNA-binding transcriptional regulator [Jiangella asiatica]|uniref:LacI family transcriptional regulator n=1 Tax=Jiangella asiatica TaxID=2530372 RepID=A0A4R5DRC0_9ACTN|nr:LacI family transcriptional regulator [Jiangella asiatica]